jgi:hypothetical protein
MQLLETRRFETGDWKELLLLLEQEVTFANAKLLTHARSMSAELERMETDVGGFHLEAGEHLPAMGLKQVSFRFFVEVVPERWWRRLVAWIGGRPPLPPRYRFGGPHSRRAAEVEVVVSAAEDGAFRAVEAAPKSGAAQPFFGRPP